MTGTRLPVAFAAGAILVAATAALIVSDAPSGATGPYAVMAAMPKTDRLDGDARFDMAFALLGGRPDRDLRIATSGLQAESCLPECSTIVFKSSGPDQPSRMMPGAAAP